MPDGSASCVYTLSDDVRDYSREEWDSKKLGRVSGTPEGFANLKGAVLKLCKQSKICTLEEIKAVEDFGKKIDTLSKETANGIR